MNFKSNPLFLNTILLGGDTQTKLSAASKAGFQQVELWQQDIENIDSSTTLTCELLKKDNLSLTDYQVLLDFDGAADTYHQQKRQEALAMLDVAEEIGANTILVPANTNAFCIEEKIEEDLCWLVEQAGRKNIRIAYEAMAWSVYINHTSKAWELIKKINAPNLGLVVDVFHIFSLKLTIEDLHGIPMDKIYLVQLSDTKDHPSKPENIKELARHHRLLPGEGDFPLLSLIEYLANKKYCGPIGLEVFNDDFKNQNPEKVAKLAMQSLLKIIN